ncbi:MAG TPA: hypothetical protein VFH47_00220 [Candidatus Thermoplasmatota archaeon]|nr:hypothetical protein [Candidatus Thermoplasmatota archaeon]
MFAQARRPLLADAVLTRLMDSLTGGTFLAGVALLVGLSNFQLAVLAALPFLAQVVQLPTVALLLRFQDRRRIVAVSAGVARLLWVLVGALLLAGLLQPSLLLLIVGAGSLLGVVAGAAWNWWMRDLLPPEVLGSFFGARLRGATVAGLAVMLLRGDEARGGRPPS